MNTLIVIESLTIVNLLNKVQFPFVKVFPPQMLSSSSEGAIVQAVPIAFAPVLKNCQIRKFQKGDLLGGPEEDFRLNDFIIANSLFFGS